MPLNPQGIPLPQTGGGPQFTPPTGLIQDYVNRMPPAQVATTSIGQGVGALAQYQQYQQARQLEALKAISELYQNVPAEQVPSYYPMLKRATGVDFGQIDQSQGTAQANAPISPSASNGGGPGTPTFASQVPTQPAQTLSPSNPRPMGMGQGGTGGYGNQAGPSIQPQGDNFPQGQPSMHPDDPGGHIQNSVRMGFDDLQGHALRIQQEMEGLQKQGPVYAAKRMAVLAPQATLLENMANSQRQGQQFQQGQEAEESRFQRGQRQKVSESVAGEVSKQRQKTTATDTAQLMLNQFANTFLSKNKNGQLADLTNPSSVPYVTGAKARLSQSTSGRYGGVSGGEMLKQAKLLGNTLVGILTSSGRMNQATAQDFVNGIIPNPDEPTSMKIKHLDDVQKLIDTVRSGDQNALDTVVATLTGGPGSAIR